MRIITSGSTYLDIDAYAGIIAYAELLQKIGVPAKAVSLATQNESIPQLVRDWQAPLETSYVPSAKDTYTLIDVSQPEYFDKFVDVARIDEIIDHHPGLEEYWEKQIGDGALIEHIGAACTQVFEQWELAGLADYISETSARLLMCGILDNTLNFGASITTPRDHHAYKQLSALANLPDDWPAQYFSACQQSVVKNLARAVANDTKVMDFKTFPHTVALGQFAVWDAEEIATSSFDTFKQVLAPKQPTWAMNIIGIGDQKSYFVTDIPEVKKWLETLLGMRFKGNLATAKRTWLRKEIMKADQQGKAPKN